MADKKTPVLMIAEGLREAGILVIVFGPMYCLFEAHDPALTLAWKIPSWLIGGVAVFGLGLELERRKK